MADATQGRLGSAKSADEIIVQCEWWHGLGTATVMVMMVVLRRTLAAIIVMVIFRHG